MTINELLEQGIVLQGKIEVRLWSGNQEAPQLIKRYEDEQILGTEDVLFQLPITYMYAIDGTLVIEVSESEGERK